MVGDLCKNSRYYAPVSVVLSTSMLTDDVAQPRDPVARPRSDGRRHHRSMFDDNAYGALHGTRTLIPRRNTRRRRSANQSLPRIGLGRDDTPSITAVAWQWVNVGEKSRERLCLLIFRIAAPTQSANTSRSGAGAAGSRSEPSRLEQRHPKVETAFATGAAKSAIRLIRGCQPNAVGCRSE
jgi:hypothetical protein